MDSARVVPSTYVLLVLCLSVGACEGGERPPDLMPQTPYCSSIEQEVASIDVVTPLGLSAREVLDQHAAPMVGQLEWTPSGDGYALLLSPGSEAVDVTVSLVYDGGWLRFLEQDVVVPEGQVDDIGVVCPDQLRIDVVLGVGTGDGALAESWSTVLVVGADPQTQAPMEPEASVDVALADLDGTLAITGIEPTTWAVSDSLRVLVEFTNGGSSGRLQTAATDPEGRSRTLDFGAWQASAS
jgi:hypothetical protein